MAQGPSSLVVWQYRLKLSTNALLNFLAVGQMAAEGQSDKMTSDMEVHRKQRCGIEFLHMEKKRHLLTFTGTC